MKDGEHSCHVAELLGGVRALVLTRVGRLEFRAAVPHEAGLLVSGKMLRTRLAAAVAEGASRPTPLETLKRACAAVELAHTASLCHDDVIDGALIRRSRPTLWRRAGSAGAVLVGDILFCAALDLMLETWDRRLMTAFVTRLTEVCEAESEQEIVWRGRTPDEGTCLRLARGKTGPLFAFSAFAAAGSDEDLGAALTEAGYALGTAYQLVDDLLDVSGEEGTAGKTLGTDFRRDKRTLAHVEPDGPERVRGHVERLCGVAAEVVAGWPAVQAGVVRFLTEDLHPLFERVVPCFRMGAENKS